MRIKANSGSKAFRHITASRGNSLEELSIRIADQFNAANDRTIEDIINSGDSHAISAAYNIFQQIGRLLDELDSYVPEVSAGRKFATSQDIKAARARAGVSRGTPEQMMDALNNKIAELGGDAVASSEQPTSGNQVPVQAAQEQDEAMDTVIRNMFEQCWDNTQDEEMSQADFIQTVKEHVQTAIEEGMLDVDLDTAMSRTDMLCNQWIDAGEGPTFTDVPGDRMEAAFADAIEAEIGNEVESLAVVAKEDALAVTIRYMGQVHEYNVPFEDIHPDMSDVDGDVAYITNTIRQDLDNLDNNV